MSRREVRKRIELTGSVATAIQEIVLDGARFDPPAIPPVVGGRMGDLSLDGLWGPLRIEDATLVWQASPRFGGSWDHAKLKQLSGLRNLPAHLDLADGRHVLAKFAATTSTIPVPKCNFDVWSIEGGASVAHWVGRIRGGGFMNANLSVSAPGQGRAQNMRLVGKHIWYLFELESNPDGLDVLIEAGSGLDHAALTRDFNALQVALGAPLQLDVVTGLDAPGNVVSCAGLHLGGERIVKRRPRADGPVPDEISNEFWIPMFFNRLARAMVEQPELPWGTAITGYLDSLSDSTIDGRYLKLHVALEAFSRALATQTTPTKNRQQPLVKDKRTWCKWVRDRKHELAAMVADAKNEALFIDKIISAMNPPSSGVVADALSRLVPPLTVDQTVIDEMGKRNIPAHHFAMNKPGVDYEVDRDVQRVNALRSLLVAVVARACRYDGAIAGWVTSNAAAWKPTPGWWPAPPATTTAEARTAYTTERVGFDQAANVLTKQRASKRRRTSAKAPRVTAPEPRSRRTASLVKSTESRRPKARK